MGSFKNKTKELTETDYQFRSHSSLQEDPSPISITHAPAFTSDELTIITSVMGVGLDTANLCGHKVNGAYSIKKYDPEVNSKFYIKVIYRISY